MVSGARFPALGARQHEMRQPAAGIRVAALVTDLARHLAANAEIEDPVREARDIVAALVEAPRHWAVVNADTLVGHAMAERARAAAARRGQGAPLAYAVGSASFRALTLHVDERVLIPRPETELLVDLVLRHLRGRTGGVAVDVGTGSGAIAIALAKEGRFDRVVATDISADALDVARANAASCGAHVEFRAGSLLSAYEVQVPRTSNLVPRTSNAVGVPAIDAVVSNLPYISFAEAQALPRSVRDWEPAVALFSGDNGMALTARLVRQAADRLAAGGLLALEVDSRRAALAAELVGADQRYANVAVQLDLAGRERFVLATRRE